MVLKMFEPLKFYCIFTYDPDQRGSVDVWRASSKRDLCVAILQGDKAVVWERFRNQYSRVFNFFLFLHTMQQVVFDCNKPKTVLYLHVPMLSF